MYRVVLDERNSYIEEVETGMSFDHAVNSILEYCRDASYDLQEAIWELVQSGGEAQFSSMPLALA